MARFVFQEMDHREQERHTEMYSSGLPKDMKTEARGTPGVGDSKPSNYGFPYNFPSAYAPPSTTAGSGAPVKQEGPPLFNLYGYQPSPSHMVTAEQLQRQGLKLKDEKPPIDNKMRYSSPVLRAQAPSPRPRESPHLQHMKEMTQSSVIVENKTNRMESPLYGGTRVSPTSSPHPQPRPAHTPEHRPDRPHSSSSTLGHPGAMHPVMAHSVGPSGLQPSHPTAFRAPDNKHGMHRSPSPYLSSSSQSQPYPSPSSIPQPIDYCKSSSSKLKAASTLPSTGAPGTVVTTLSQAPVSLAPSNCSYSLIQQGLVPNPLYSQGSSFSASKPTSVQLAKGAPPSTMPSLNPLGSQAAHSGAVHPSPSAQQTQQHHLLQHPYQQMSPQQSITASGAKKRNSNNREAGATIRKRQKPVTVEVPPVSNPNLHPSAHPTNPHPGQHSSTHPVPVTTSHVLCHPSAISLPNAYRAQSNGTASQPPSMAGSQAAMASSSCFMDSFKSFVENTVQAAFNEDKEKGNGVSPLNPSQEHQSLASSVGERVVEKMEVTSSAGNDDTSSSVVTNASSQSSQMASIMETINRVANGQMDTDSDTLSAPSPPPTTSQPDASPAARSSQQANHPKLKKFWLKRHSDEDKEKGRPASVVQPPASEDNGGGNSNASNAASSNNSGASTSGSAMASQEDKKPVATKMEEASAEELNSSGPSPAPAPASSLANGMALDSHANDESTSSASEGETQVSLPL